MTEPGTDLGSRLDADVRAMAAADRAPAAILAAVAGGETVISCFGDPQPDVHTVFELGSITKTFTALLLAEMVGCGEVGYNDPIAAYLPPHAVPRHATEPPITMAHLATHTGGLPRLPANLYLPALRSWSTNPYAHYRLDHLYRATSRLRPRTAPGTRVRYSNFGVGLLGQLLANAAGRGYRDLVVDRVCGPLGMTETLAVAGEACAMGHRRGRPVPPWEMDALAPAGVLRSSAADLLRYLNAQLHPQTTPLTDALRATQQPRVAAKGRQSVCLVWNHRRFRFGDVLFHGGGTRGFTAFIGFCPQAGTGVITLINATPTRGCTVTQTTYNLLKALSRESRAGVA